MFDVNRIVCSNNFLIQLIPHFILEKEEFGVILLLEKVHEIIKFFALEIIGKSQLLLYYLNIKSLFFICLLWIKRQVKVFEKLCLKFYRSFYLAEKLIWIVPLGRKAVKKVVENLFGIVFVEIGDYRSIIAWFSLIGFCINRLDERLEEPANSFLYL